MKVAKSTQMGCIACMVTAFLLSTVAIGHASTILESGTKTDRLTPPVTFTGPALKTLTDSEAKNAIQSAKNLSRAFRHISNQLLPSVVAIENRTDNSRGPQQIQNGMPPRGGVGSGVIIDPDGWIMTNNHVVAGAGSIVVRLHDGREFMAEQVMTDPKTDIAIVRIPNAENLTAAKIGNSNDSYVGDWVLALGQPFGLESTVTAGIISAKGRGIGLSDSENHIQTDAAINPGNSGGPMVNLDGEVIGINTAISSSSGGSDGVGFAVPINLANWVANQLMDHGTVRRAFLGVGIQPITQKLANHFNVPPKQGLLITHVIPESPAANAGVRTGDILLKFADARISAPNEFQTFVERANIGQTYELTVNRNGTLQILDCVPQSQPNRPDKDAGRLMNTSHSNRTSSGRLGIRVGDFDATVAKKMGIDAAEGVLILAIQPGGEAHRAGLVPGMILTEVNHKKIESLSQFNQLMSELNLDESLLFLTMSQNGSRFVVIDS